MVRKEECIALLEQGLKAVDSGNYAMAMDKLDNAGQLGVARTPEFDAAYAVCLAALKQQYNHAISICRWAIELEPCESGHYLQLGRVYLHANQRKEALHCFKEGILYRRDQRIIKELKRLGDRRPPVFHQLPRGHFLNRVTGKLFAKLRRP